MKHNLSGPDFDKVKAAWRRQLDEVPQWSAESISRAVHKAIQEKQESETNIFSRLFFWQYGLAFCLSLLISFSVFSLESTIYSSNDQEQFIMLLAQSDNSWFFRTSQSLE